MKKCNVCTAKKDLTEFYFSKKKNDYLKTCNKCRTRIKGNYTMRTKTKEIPERTKLQLRRKEALENGNYYCNNCKIEQPKDNFRSNKNSTVDGYFSKCKKCTYKMEKIVKFIKYYNISRDLANEILNKEVHNCSICYTELNPFSNVENKNSSVHIDHCHNSNLFRGILCSNCNRALGLFGDNPHIIKNAYNYLAQFKSDKLLEKPEEVNQQPIISLND